MLRIGLDMFVEGSPALIDPIWFDTMPLAPTVIVGL